MIVVVVAVAVAVAVIRNSNVPSHPAQQRGCGANLRAEPSQPKEIERAESASGTMRSTIRDDCFRTQAVQRQHFEQAVAAVNDASNLGDRRLGTSRRTAVGARAESQLQDLDGHTVSGTGKIRMRSSYK
jgi:hypothetical protein